MATPTVDLLKDDSDMTMHSHVASDLRDLVTVTTLATILATTPTVTTLAYASDTSEFYIYADSAWKVAPLELSTRSATPDMGAYTQTNGQGISDLQGYYDTAITDKLLHNCAIKGNANTVEGSVRTTTTGSFQIYLNARWNTVVINFVFREDSTGAYELEHQPVGFNLYYELMTGNSDLLGVDGKPMVQQYSADIGAYQSDLIIDFGTF